MSAVLDLLDSFVTEVRTEASTAEIAVATGMAGTAVIVASLVADRVRPSIARPDLWRVARALAVAVMFVESSVQVSKAGWLTGADAATLEWFTTHRSPAVTTVASAVTTVGSPVGLAVIGVLLAGLVGWQHRSVVPSMLLLSVVVVSFGASTLTKVVVGRARPPAVVQLVSETDFSFPSGHVTGTTALAGALLVVFLGGRPEVPRRLAAAVLSTVVVALVAVTRLYLGVHWLTDVIGGVLLGVTVVLIGAVVAPHLPHRSTAHTAQQDLRDRSTHLDAASLTTTSNCPESGLGCRHRAARSAAPRSCWPWCCPQRCCWSLIVRARVGLRRGPRVTSTPSATSPTIRCSCRSPEEILALALPRQCRRRDHDRSLGRVDGHHQARPPPTPHRTPRPVSTTHDPPDASATASSTTLIRTASLGSHATGDPINPGGTNMNPLAPAIHALVHPRRWGLRVRSALIAAVVVTVGLGIATLSLTYVLYRSLLSASNDAATDRISAVTSQLALDTPVELDRSALATDSRIAIVQIIDQTGNVVQSSTNSPAEPITTIHPAPGVVAHDLPATRGAGETRVSAATVDGLGGRYTIAIATNQEEIEETIKLVAILVALATPFIAGLAATATYSLIGRSLRSVERIRTRVAAITSADLADRVPVPEQNDEIAALARTMNDMLTRIETGHNTQRRFISDASHELRSPLTTITAALELGRNHPTTLTADLVDDTLLPEAHRMRHLIDDLLLLARADENALSHHRVEVDLDDLIAAEATRLATSPLTIDTTTEPARTTGDPNQLTRAIRNLLDNATRYAATTVNINLQRHTDHAHIEIADDGPGIDPQDRQHVFDRFYRPQHDRGRDTGGFGLGLAIVAEIITVHHGTVRIDQNTPTGAKVIIDLPLTHP